MNKKDGIFLKEYLKRNDALLKESGRTLKQIEKDDERIVLESGINFYKLQELLGSWHDKDDQKEQSRRLWKLSIIKNGEDDEFLKKHGLIHISKLKGENKNEKRAHISIPKIEIPEDIKIRAQNDLKHIREMQKKGHKIGRYEI